MSHEHEWKRVPPRVVPIGEAYRYGHSNETYNAYCLTCGVRAWLHWPEQRYKERSW